MDLDSVIHQPTRLQIMSSLVSLDGQPQIDFTELQKLLELTPGNLSTHLVKLENAGYVEVTKEFVKRRPKIWVAITDAGMEAFRRHVTALEKVLGLK